MKVQRSARRAYSRKSEQTVLAELGAQARAACVLESVLHDLELLSKSGKAIFLTDDGFSELKWYRTRRGKNSRGGGSALVYRKH